MRIMAELSDQEKLDRSEKIKIGLRKSVEDGQVLGRPRKQIDVERILELNDLGMGCRKIGAIVGLSRATIHTVLKEKLKYNSGRWEKR